MCTLCNRLSMIPHAPSQGESRCPAFCSMSSRTGTLRLPNGSLAEKVFWSKTEICKSCRFASKSHRIHVTGMVRVYLHLIHFYGKPGWVYYTWILWEHSHKLANWFSNQKSDFQALPCSNFLMLLHHYCCCCSGYVWPLAQIAWNNQLNCLFLFSIGV